MIGLEIRSETSNVLLLTAFSRITRQAGFINTGTADGSFVIPANLNGAFFFYSTNSPRSTTGVAGPSISLLGRTISWTFRSYTATRKSIKIVYGAY